MSYSLIFSLWTLHIIINLLMASYFTAVPTTVRGLIVKVHEILSNIRTLSPYYEMKRCNLEISIRAFERIA